ncbi:response regulator transcription factor [Flavobacterium sp.]|jgi:DNA-binding NarL/FixJ family response regulator|uniref:response regulator transcription factor n=1 Tax=Flavobacterium sp. TaxID=239 RepID=UPI002A83B003|nr:response regulator transcription factor [Flavobacterium sp.]
MNKQIKIVLVDDEALIRKGVKAILEQEDNFEIVEEFENGSVFVDYIESIKELPDIVLMDVKMPSLNGVEATKFLTAQFPDLKIIALSNYNSEVFVSNMLEVGAVCYISKSASPDEIVKNINLVYENGFYYNDSIMDYVLNNTPKNKSFFDSAFLTERESEVLQLICKQKSSTEIGEVLFISPRTVDGHRNNLLFKTESKNIVGLVIFAIHNSLFIPDIES